MASYIVRMKKQTSHFQQKISGWWEWRTNPNEDLNSRNAFVKQLFKLYLSERQTRRLNNIPHDILNRHLFFRMLYLSHQCDHFRAFQRAHEPYSTASLIVRWQLLWLTVLPQACEAITCWVLRPNNKSLFPLLPSLLSEDGKLESTLGRYFKMNKLVITIWWEINNCTLLIPRGTEFTRNDSGLMD